MEIRIARGRDSELTWRRSSRYVLVTTDRRSRSMGRLDVLDLGARTSDRAARVLAEKEACLISRSGLPRGGGRGRIQGQAALGRGLREKGQAVRVFDS